MKDYYAGLEFVLGCDNSFFEARVYFDNGFFSKIIKVSSNHWMSVVYRPYPIKWHIGYPSPSLTPLTINKFCDFIDSINGKTPENYVEWVLGLIGKSEGVSVITLGNRGLEYEISV